MYQYEIVGLQRWKLIGRLHTTTPLHIGDGEHPFIAERHGQRPDGHPGDAKFASVFMDHQGKPVIPATSLKGALLNWAENNLGTTEASFLREAFGKQDLGGAVVFRDARLVKDPDRPPDRGGRFYDPERRTCLTPQVVITPETRTAKDGLLYYSEFVPEGAQFEVVLDGQSILPARPGDLTRDKLFTLISQAFGSGITLGAESASQWGKMTWRPTNFQELDSGRVKDWILGGGVGNWETALVDSPFPQVFKLDRVSPPQELQITLDLQFDGAMLINDPSRVVAGKNPIAHAAIRSAKGDRPILPASSLRGAFRAQANRIWQTIATGRPANSGVKQAPRSGDEKRLTPFLKLFGATGWKSPIEIGDFQLIGQGLESLQEFVAVDRFTGGVAGSKKFNALRLWKPHFQGTLNVNLDRLNAAEVGGWIWLVLAYVLRDWAEGDGRIGFGSSKGYGGFRATIKIEGDGPEAALLASVIQRDAAALQDKQLDTWQAELFERLGPKQPEVAA